MKHGTRREPKRRKPRGREPQYFASAGKKLKRDTERARVELAVRMLMQSGVPLVGMMLLMHHFGRVR